MEKSPYHILFEKILSEKQFAELSSFRAPESWKDMNSNEKELLGSLFILQGSDLASKGDKEAVKCFKLAAQAAPKSPEIFLKLGDAYVEMGKSLRNLKAACRFYQKAIELDPNFQEAWVAGAFAETIFSELCQNPKLSERANEKFEMALKLAQTISPESTASLYQKWGIALYKKAKLSGEPYDFHQAIAKLGECININQNEAEFWNDYGNILAELGTLVGQMEFFSHAKEAYLKSLNLKPSSMTTWLNLACANMKLFESSFQECYYLDSEKAFQKASEIDPNNLSLWLFWGSLELLAAKLSRDVECLQSAIEKFELADVCEPNNPEILIRWGEALMCLGAQEEQYELLREAEEKILRSISLDSDKVESWYFLGRCFTELGRYFNDIHYFVSAIEKYHHGLKIDPSFHIFHYGIALCYLEMADHKIESEYIECSLHHFTRLSETSLPLPPQFWLDFGIALIRCAEQKNDKKSAELAVAKLEKALVMQEHTFLSPLFMDSLYHYASALQILGDLIEEPAHIEKAVKFFGHIIKEEPSYTPARFGLAHSLFHLGELLADADCLKEAWDIFEQIVLEDPEEDIAWGDLGALIIAYAELTKDPIKMEEYQWLLDVAEQKLQTAIYLGNENAYYTLACIHSLKGNLADSLHYIEKSLSAKALPAIEDVLHDEWLINLRTSQEFRLLLSRFFKDSF